MIRGIYTAASGMIAETVRSDVTANNLANASTAGFKKDVAVNRDFANLLLQRIDDGPENPVIGSLGIGATVDEIAVDHSAGSLRHTGNPLDFAIEGKGFFTIQTPAGLRFTRNGSFTRNAQGQLVDGNGNPVLGENGVLNLPAGTVTVTGEGRVLIDGAETGRLRLTGFADERQLAKEGDGSFIAAPGTQLLAAGGGLRQGFLEQSNVNIITEMVNLINGYRTYEVNAKTVQAHDQLLDKAVNEVGKV